MYESLKTTIDLKHQTKTELGIERDEKLHISKIIGNYELVEVQNQYSKKYTTNPNNLIES